MPWLAPGPFVDLLGSCFCGLIALCCFILHIISKPSNKHWFDFPNYVRWGLFVTGMLMTYRSATFTFPSDVPGVAGRLPLHGLLATIALAYTFVAFTVHSIRRTYPERVWDRMKYVESLADCGRGGALALLAMAGVKVVPPGGTKLPEDV